VKLTQTDLILGSLSHFLWRLRYAFDDSAADKEYGPEWCPDFIAWKLHWLYLFAGLFSRAWCRWRGHPAGVFWYNPSGMEPDMRCKGCGEDLG